MMDSSDGECVFEERDDSTCLKGISGLLLKRPSLDPAVLNKK